MGAISSIVDRLLHGTARSAGPPASHEALDVHAREPVVDLVVGTALFRESFVRPAGRGHVDLPRLRAAGVNLVGLTVATRFPDLRGTLSRHHFRWLGAPPAALAGNMALAEWLISRIEGWCRESEGELRLVHDDSDLEACLADGGPVGVFIGIQGGHVLDADLANVERLRRRGVLMLAPAHVMDNDFVGSSTGRRRDGLSGAGRELVAEIERQGMLVDLAHMSTAGIADALHVARRPPLVSHTGLLARAARGSRWRRYSAATRNVPDWVVQEVGRRDGVVGLVLATRLIGGETVEDAAAAFARAVELGGPAGVAIGSDMDGGLRMVVDAAGLPKVAEALLAAGLTRDVVAGLVGRNAVRLLRAALAQSGEV